MVAYSVSGTATAGVDFQALSGSVTIPIGADHADIAIVAVDDAFSEGEENVLVTVLPAPGYIVGSNPSASVNIIDDEFPVVSVAATDDLALEGSSPPNNGVFTVTRTGPVDVALTVDLVVGGGATSGVDYAPIPSSVTIPIGLSAKSITVTALDDNETDPDETVYLTVVNGFGYAAGDPASASVSILDNELVIDVSVAASTDDSEESDSGSMYSTSSDLELVEDGLRGAQNVGMRFVGVDIPIGSTISAAWLQFEVDEVGSSATSLLIEGQAADDPPTFGSQSGNISARPRTVEQVVWVPPPWSTTGEAGPDHRTPDLTAIIQEIVDRPGWSPGNAIAMIVSGSGARVATSFDGGGPLGAPALHLEILGSAAPVNAPPAAHASGEAVVFPNAATLVGTVSDDGLPDPPSTLTTSWSLVAGPGAATIVDPSALTTTVTFSLAGVYEFELAAHDGELSTSDTVSLAVVDPAVVSDTIRFAAFGDYGTGCCAESAVASLVSSLDPDFIITTGDNRYGPDIDVAVGQFYSDYIGNYVGTYGEGSPINRFFPALGNHDYNEVGGVNVTLDYFTLPGGAIPTSGTSGNERYYDYVQGPVHFFVLNSDSREPDGRSSTSLQAQWLQTQLAVSTSPWQIVYLHFAPFSSGDIHGSDPALQWPFEAWGADAVLAGHDHTYERLQKGGIPYFVTGSGGKSLYALGPTPDPDSQFFYVGDFGTMLVEACAARLSFEFHSVSEGIVDSHSVGAPSCSAANSAPTAVPDVVSTGEDTSVVIDVAGNDLDVDGNLDVGSTNVACVGCTVPSNGILVNEGDGTFTYTPDSDYYGPDSFTYEICDTEPLCDSAVVSITVVPVNDMPTAVGDVVSTPEDTSVVVDVAGNDTDPENDLLTVTAVSVPGNGVLVNEGDGTFTYTPDSDYNRPDSFVYEICDTEPLCDSAVVSITVVPVNDAPTAMDDVVSTPEDTSVVIDVAGNDTDPENDLLTVTAVSTPGAGTASINGDGTVTYTPNLGHTGSDTFTYTTCDPEPLCDSATVTVTTNPSAPQTFEKRVAAGSDDAEERDSGNVSLNSSDLELVEDGSRGAQTVGVRLTGIDIPAGATITEAWIQYQVDNTDSGATDLIIQGEAGANPPTFINSTNNISNRSRTSAQVAWSPAPWTTSGEAGPDQQTSDLSSIIQEMIDLPGWTQGNAIVIITTGTGERTADSYNGNPSAAPLLHIKYTT